MNKVLLYYITDRTQFPGDECARRKRLLEKIAEAAHAGIDYIQLREKDLPARELEALAHEAAQRIRNAEPRTGNGKPRTALLINSRTDIAISAGAHGVHLPSNEIAPSEVKMIWNQCGAGAPARELSPKAPLISVSCHSAKDISRAAEEGADLALAAPIFQKKDFPTTNPIGLAALRELCHSGIPVLALGGITLQNARACIEAGAIGIAAIRLFQENSIAEVVRVLRDR